MHNGQEGNVRAMSYSRESGGRQSVSGARDVQAEHALVQEHVNNPISRLSSSHSQRGITSRERRRSREATMKRRARDEGMPQGKEEGEEEEVLVNEEILVHVSDEEDGGTGGAGYDYDEQAQEVTAKHLFSQLDPAVARVQGEAMGELGVGFKYRTDRNLLLVKINSASGLGNYQVSKNKMKVHILVSLVDYTPQVPAKKTTVKKNTSNPTWNEILYFNLDKDAVEDTRVLFQVFDGLDVIGEIMVPLDWKILDGETEWFLLENKRDWDIKGDVNVRISYTTPTVLHVNIASAEGICGKNPNQLSNAYARITVAGKYPVRTTKVVKDSTSPVWSEVFDFNVPVQLLHTVTVLIALYNKGTKKDDDFIGEVRISLRDFKHFQQIDDWYPLADLKHIARHRSEWSKQAIEQELREAMVAHIACKSPGLMFGKHQYPNRIVRLRCDKIGQSSHIKFIDGRPCIEDVN